MQLTADSAAGRRRLNRLWYERPWLKRLAPYLVVAAVAGIAAAFVVRPWSVAPDALLTGGGDAPWLQASVQAAGQVGPFGTTPHMNWPAGFSSWSLPQLGLGLLAGAWLLNGVLGVGSAASVLWLVCVVIAIDAAAMLFLFRSWLGSHLVVLACTLSVALPLSPFVFTPLSHLNVAAFALLPLALALLVRGRGRGPRWWAVAALVLAAGGVLFPLWWCFVVLLTMAVMMVGRLLQRNWSALAQSAVVGLAIGVGVGGQLLLYRQAAIPGEAATRGAWDSDKFGGHLLDFLYSSPLLNSRFPSLHDLGPGISVEFKPLGFVGAVGAVFCVLMLLKGLTSSVVLSRSDVIRTGTLSLATVTAVLLFLTGGVGGVQAGLAVLVGGESPARVWSRMSILMAMLGLAWTLVYGAKLRSRIPGGGRARVLIGCAVVVAVGAMTAADLKAHLGPARKLTADAAGLPERAAVDFLTAAVSPCPVAQLPLDTAPSMRLRYRREVEVEWLKYRGYVPYLLAPSFYWSFGPYVPDSPGVLYGLGTSLTSADGDRIARAGYCAIFYDREIADFAAAQHVELQGQDVGELGAPSFRSGRYEVYLLGGP